MQISRYNVLNMKQKHYAEDPVEEVMIYEDRGSQKRLKIPKTETARTLGCGLMSLYSLYGCDRMYHKGPDYCTFETEGQPVSSLHHT